MFKFNWSFLKSFSPNSLDWFIFLIFKYHDLYEHLHSQRFNQTTTNSKANL